MQWSCRFIDICAAPCSFYSKYRFYRELLLKKKVLGELPADFPVWAVGRTYMTMLRIGVNFFNVQ